MKSSKTILLFLTFFFLSAYPAKPWQSGISPVSAATPGDATGEGIVNGADYTIWASHYNQSTENGPTDGDFNNSGIVDGADYVIWANNYDM